MNAKDPISIFIVDDNKLFALALKADIEKAFESLPMTIHVFESGEKCIESYKEELPHIVILDYHLNSKYPNAVDGIKVLEWIKKQDEDTGVIMLTGDDDLDVALKSFHHGASDYVVKSSTQFRKINYSLLNLFKMMEAKNYATRYKRQVTALLILMALLIGGMISVQLF